jgi:hypothetical protein
MRSREFQSAEEYDDYHNTPVRDDRGDPADTCECGRTDIVSGDARRCYCTQCHADNFDNSLSVTTEAEEWDDG